jgi:hypothetical protein
MFPFLLKYLYNTDENLFLLCILSILIVIFIIFHFRFRIGQGSQRKMVFELNLK